MQASPLALPQRTAAGPPARVLGGAQSVSVTSARRPVQRDSGLRQNRPADGAGRGSDTDCDRGRHPDSMPTDTGLLQ